MNILSHFSHEKQDVAVRIETHSFIEETGFEKQSPSSRKEETKKASPEPKKTSPGGEGTPSSSTPGLKRGVSGYRGYLKRAPPQALGSKEIPVVCIFWYDLYICLFPLISNNFYLYPHPFQAKIHANINLRRENTRGE